MKKPEKRVIFAVDPFDPALRPNKSSLSELRSWLSRMNASVDLVYVHTIPAGSKNLSDIAESVELQLKKYVASLKLGSKTTSHLIIEKTSSRKNAVKAIINYAKNQAAEFIILTAYGKKSLGRLVLGGFANILLSESPYPILFLGSKKESTPWSNRILFPTDFSPGSKLAFKKCLEQFSALRSEITLFHVNTSTMLGYVATSYSAYLPENYWQTRAADALREGQVWVETAKKAGFKARCIIDETSTNVTKAIEREAKRQKVGLIALSSVSNRIRLRVFGSVAAHLFQLRTHPVWVCGPEAIKEQFSTIEKKPQATLSRKELSVFDDLWL